MYVFDLHCLLSALSGMLAMLVKRVKWCTLVDPMKGQGWVRGLE